MLAVECGEPVVTHVTVSDPSDGGVTTKTIADDEIGTQMFTKVTCKAVVTIRTPLEENIDKDWNSG